MTALAAGEEPSRHDRVRLAARDGLTHLGLRAWGPLVRLGTAVDRTSRQVVKARVRATSGWSWVAVKVVLEPGQATKAAFAWEHQVARNLHALAAGLVRDGDLPHNPIMPVLHDKPVDLGNALVAVARFVPGTGSAVTAERWGETVGLLHVLGVMPAALRLLTTHPATNALSGLTAAPFLHALNRPDHPFRNQQDLITEFVHTLKDRVLHAVRLDPDPLMIHRDLHALNCIDTREGGVVIDWQEAGWGNRSDDFAWMYLAVNRFGAPARILEIAKRAYARATRGACPTDEQIEASGQVRELLCLGFSLQNAYRSPQHLQECLTELSILTDPRASTDPWRMLFNPAIFMPGVVA
jgi:hypothetical protein